MDKTDKVIDLLRGTCNFLAFACDICGVDLDDLDYEKLDSEIFCCDTCGWWCDISELSTEVEHHCSDCYPEEESE